MLLHKQEVTRARIAGRKEKIRNFSFFLGIIGNSAGSGSLGQERRKWSARVFRVTRHTQPSTRSLARRVYSQHVEAQQVVEGFRASMVADTT
jgi:hypothetical protein